MGLSAVARRAKVEGGRHRPFQPPTKGQHKHFPARTHPRKRATYCAALNSASSPSSAAQNAAASFVFSSSVAAPFTRAMRAASSCVVIRPCAALSCRAAITAAVRAAASSCEAQPRLVEIAKIEATGIRTPTITTSTRGRIHHAPL